MHEGGCLCGAVRYGFEGAPQAVEWCHCRLCQKASGAPATAWATLSRAQFRFLRGEPAYYSSSPKARRGFCPLCGTQLTFEYLIDATDELDITVASLDQPDAFPPAVHIWASSRLAWVPLPEGAVVFEGEEKTSSP